MFHQTILLENEDFVACITLLCVSVSSLFTFTRKLRSGVSEVVRSMRLRVYVFYSTGILWSTCSVGAHITHCWLIFNPLCNVLYVAAAPLYTLWSFLLSMILIHRVDSCFLGTPFQISTDVVWTLSAALFSVWSILGVLMAAYMCTTLHLLNDEECLINDIPEVLMVITRPLYMAIMLCNLLSTTGLWAWFVLKLNTLHSEFTRNCPDSRGQNSDYVDLMTLIQKQSIIIFWIMSSTVALVATAIAVHGRLRRVPVVVDMIANSVFVFLSFQVNDNLYRCCRCHQCAECMVGVLGSFKNTDDGAGGHNQEADTSSPPPITTTTIEQNAVSVQPQNQPIDIALQLAAGSNQQSQTAHSPRETVTNLSMMSMLIQQSSVNILIESKEEEPGNFANPLGDGLEDWKEDVEEPKSPNSVIQRFSREQAHRQHSHMLSQEIAIRKLTSLPSVADLIHHPKREPTIHCVDPSSGSRSTEMNTECPDMTPG